MFKKGQGATEYLIILAIVIIIALIVIGVIGGIPSIGISASSRASSTYGQLLMWQLLITLYLQPEVIQ